MTPTDRRPIPLTCGGTAYHDPDTGTLWLCDQCFAPVPTGAGMPALCAALHDAGGLLP
jgi:hypothetical protein